MDENNGMHNGMVARRLRFRAWAAASLILSLGVMGSSVLAAMLLDAFARRPAPMSVTTLFPGFVYAAATVMKVCVISGFIAVLAAAASRWMPIAKRDVVEARMPMRALISVTLPALTPLVGCIAVLIGQEIAASRTAWTVAEASSVSRIAVLVALAMISLGGVTGIMSIRRRERPFPLAGLGMLTNALLLALFLHLRFFAPGFDQDGWAPR